MENNEQTGFDGQENEFNTDKINLPQDARLGFFEQAEQRAKNLPKFESADSQYSKMVDLYEQNKKLNSENIAKAKAYAEKYGYDPAVVYSNIKNLDDAQKSWKLEFFAKNTEDNPVTAKYMTDVNIQPYIKDDYENIALWERYVKSVYYGAKTSYLNARMSIAALSLAKKEINGSDGGDILRDIEGWRKELNNMPQRNKKEKAFFSGSWVHQGSETGSQVVASMLPGAATGAAGGAVLGPEGAAAGALIGGIIGGFVTGFTLEGGGAYLQYREITDENGNKISPKAAANMAAEVGVMNGLIEAAGDSIIVGRVLMPAGKMAKKMAAKPLEKWLKSEAAVKLLEKSPLMKKAAEKIISKPSQFQNMTPAAALKKAAAAFAESEAGEVSQEFLQETVTGAGEEALKNENFLTQSAAAARIKAKYGVDYTDIEDNLGKLTPEDRTLWLNAKKSVGQILKDSSEVILPTLIGTAPFALLGGVSTYKSVNIAAERSRALDLAGQKISDEQTEKALAQMHSNITVTETNPKAAAVIMQDVAQQTDVPTTFVKKDKFFQVISAGVDNFDAALEEADLKQEWESAQNNDTGFVEIPTGKWLNLRKQITGNMSTVYDQLKNDIKFKVDGYTTNEILEARENAVKQAKSALDKILKEDAELKGTAEFFAAEAEKELKKLPKPEAMSDKEWQESKQAYITLASLYALRTAKRKGLSNEEAVQKIRLPKIQVQLSKRQQELKEMAEMFADDVSGDIESLREAEANEGQSTTPVTDAVIAAGGIKVKGHKSESDFENFSKKESGVKGVINNNSGLTPEQMAYRVFETGQFVEYFNPEGDTSPDVNILLQALEDERGKFVMKSDRAKATQDLRKAEETLDMTSEEFAWWYEKTRGVKLPKAKELKQLYRFYLKAMADRGSMPTQRALREYGLTAEDLTEQGEDVSFDFGENSGGGYSGEVVFQFGGPKAENADTLALGKAKKMEQSGTDGETIRKQTGWFKGADGKWRFEISDKEVEINSDVVDGIKKDLQQSKESGEKQIDLYNAELHRITELHDKKQISDEDFKEQYDKVMNEKLTLAEKLQTPRVFRFTLGEVLKHDKLFKAYPELKNMPVEITPMGYKTGGSFDGETIQLNSDLVLRNNKESREVLLHEIQHAIQQKEGFAKGGNPEQFADRTRQAEIKRDLAKLKEREQAGEDVSEEIAQAEFELNSIKEGQTDKYLHLAGEMEARNTERRANMSEQERQDTPPQDTQDYKDSDAIVVFGGTQTAYHAWYEAPYKNFGDFFDAVKNNNRPNNKSFYIYKIKNGLNIVIPSDSVVNNSKFSKMASEEWQDVLDNIDNIKNGFVSNDKKGAMYKGYPIYLKIERNKNFYGVLLEYTNNNKLILTKIFKDFDEKNIDEWIKERESVRTPETFIFKIRPTTNKSRRPTTPDRSPYTFLTYIVQKVKRYKENNNETNTPYIVVTKNSIGSLREKKTRKEILSDINYKNFNEDFKSNSIPEKINAVEKYIKTVLEEYGFDYIKTEKSEKSNSRYVYFKDKNAGEIIYGFRISDHKYISKYEKRFPDRVQHLNTEQRPEEIAGIVDNYLSKPNTQQQNDNYETVLGSFEGGEEPVITLGEKANFSTLLHEFAHFLHYDMKQALAEHPNDKTLAQEMEVLRKWYGGSYKFVVSEIAKDPRYSKEEKEQILKTIKERGGEKYIEQVAGKEQRDENDTAENAVRYQFEELFARGFEKYLQTGKAPVAKLNGLFAKVRKWMLKVYKKLALNPNIELSEEVTDMFNALIVADETIDTWFKSPRIKAAATEGLFADIKDGNIREELKAELFEILKNDIEAKKKLNIGQVRKKAKEAAEKYVKNNPAYKALDSVRYGLKKNPKDAAQDFLDGKLSRNDRLKFEGIYRKYADVFTSSLDMARKLAELPNRAEYVKQAQENAEREALELAIDNPEKLEAFVREIACNNQKNMELGLLELKYLEERLNSLEQDNKQDKAKVQAESRLYLNAMKNRFKTMAAEYIRGKVLKQAGNINAYYRKAIEAAAKAAVCFESGDIYAAYDYKLQQLQFLAIAAEAIRVSKLTEKYKQYLNDLRKAKPEGFKNVFDFEQAADLLRRFGFGRRDFDPEEKRQTLEAYLNKKLEAKIIDTRPEFAEFILNEKVEKNFKDLTFEELEDIVRALKFIKKAASAEDKFDVLAGKAEISEITGLAMDALNENFTPEQRAKNQKEIDEKSKGIYKWISAWKVLFGTLKEMATIVHKLDGGKDGGVFAQLFLEPVAVCADTESKMKRAFSDRLLAAAKQIGGEEYLQDCLAQAVEFDGGVFNCNKLNLIMLALNWGNLSNRRVLKAVPPYGYKGDEQEWRENADIILEYEFKRHLTAADWQFVQNLWNALEEIGKEQFKVEERVRGFAPKKVEPYGFTIDTADGKRAYLSGGYFPLMMDRRTVRGLTIDSENKLSEKIKYAYHTDRGAMMKRTGAVYPVSLEFTDLAQKVNDSIHDICFRELVNDYNRLMRKRLFAVYLRQCAGASDFVKIGEYIDFLAGGTREYNRIAGLDSIVNWLRKGFTISALTLNAGVIVQNLSNPFTLENVVDGFGKAEVFKTILYAAKMMPSVLAGTKEGREFKEFVYSKSQMMKDREEANDIIFEQVREYDTIESGNLIEKNNSKLMALSNWLFNASDNITMMPAWYVAYEQGINELKLSEEKAALRADEVVKRTVGSGRKYDVSSLQRNKQVLANILTPFMTFFNKELNKIIRETYRDYHKKEFGRMAWFYFQKFVLFAALSELMAFRPPEEDEPWWKWLIESSVSFTAGLTPVTRGMPALVLNNLLGFDGFYGSTETPVESAIKKAFYRPLASGLDNAAKTIGLKDGEADWQRFAEDIAGSASVFMPYPNALNSLLFNMIDIYNDEMDFKMKDLVRRRPKKEKNNA